MNIIESFQKVISKHLFAEKMTTKNGKKYNDYQLHFLDMMKKFGIKSPKELKTDEEKKKFFDAVDKSWKAKKETD